MRIGFDAKRAFHNNSGLGNYSRDLIRIISNELPEDEFYMYNPKPKTRVFGENTVNTQQVNPAGIWKNVKSLWRTYGISKDIDRDQLDLFIGLSNELPASINYDRSIVVIHDLIFERFPEWYKPIDRKIYRKKFKQASLNAKLVIAISEQTKRDLINLYQIPSNKIKVVYQGCHHAFQKTVSKDYLETIRSKFKLPEKFVLSVGTIEPRKNLLTVVKALKDQNDIPLVVVGRETAYAEKVKSFIREHGMENHVHFLKNVNMEELASIYKLATLFTYPSQFEGFGIPIIEALFSETPVITSTGSCFSEAGGPNSIYLPFEDVDTWKTSISGLWQDDNQQKQMAQMGLEYAQQFKDERIFETWKKIIDQFR